MLLQKYVTDVSKLQVDKQTYDQAVHNLAQRDQDRLNRFRFDRDARSFLLGRWLPQYAAKKRLRIAGDLELVATDKGRLSFRGLPLLDFNTSHDGDFVILGMIQNDSTDLLCTIGIDISKIPIDQSEEYQKDGLTLLSSQFTQKEKEWFLDAQGESTALESRSLHDRLCALHTLWSIKEAYLKCTGRGIDGENAMSSIETTYLTKVPHKSGVQSPQARRPFDPSEDVCSWKLTDRTLDLSDWSVTTTWLDDLHVCATVISPPGPDLSHSTPFEAVDPNDVIRWAALVNDHT